MHYWMERGLKTALTIALGTSILGGSLHAESDEPFIYATEVSGEDVVVSVHVPSGYQSAVLEISNDVNAGWQPIVAGTMAGEEGLVTSPLLKTSKSSAFGSCVTRRCRVSRRLAFALSCLT